MGGEKFTSKAEKQGAGRGSQRRKKKKNEDLLRATGGPGCGMNLETQVNVADVGQGEDDADMRQQDRELVTITQHIDVAKTLMDLP